MLKELLQFIPMVPASPKKEKEGDIKVSLIPMSIYWCRNGGDHCYNWICKNCNRPRGSHWNGFCYDLKFDKPIATVFTFLNNDNCTIECKFKYLLEKNK